MNSDIQGFIPVYETVMAEIEVKNPIFLELS